MAQWLHAKNHKKIFQGKIGNKQTNEHRWTDKEKDEANNVTLS